MENREIVAFTGHRPQKVGGYSIPNPTYNHICSELRRILIEINPIKAISGMALGVDQWAAEICIELGIPFIAAIPFIGQEKKWPTNSQVRYNKLLSKAAEKIIVSEGGYEPKKMQTRNEWMVDHATVVVGVWDSTPGGTGNCIRYVKEQEKRLIVVNPISL